MVMSKSVVVSFKVFLAAVKRTLPNIGKFCLVVVGPKTLCKFSTNISLLIINLIVVIVVSFVNSVEK